MATLEELLQEKERRSNRLTSLQQEKSRRLGTAEADPIQPPESTPERLNLSKGGLVSPKIVDFGLRKHLPGISAVDNVIKKGVDVFTGELRKTTETEEASRAFGLDDPSKGPLKSLKLEETRKALGDVSWGEAARFQSRVAFMIATTPDDAEKVNILKEINPDITTRTDDKGNIFVQYPGEEKERILNKPGASPSEIVTLSVEAAKGIPAGRLAGVAGGVVGKVGLGIVGEAATVAAEEGLQVLQGGEFDLGNVAIGALFGGGAEALGGAARGIWSRLNPEQKAKVQAAKTLDDLQEAGIDREEIAQIIESHKQAVKEAGEAGIESPTFPQVAAREGVEQVNAPMSQLRVASEADEGFARAALNERNLQERSIEGAAQEIFGEASSSRQLNALTGVSEASENILETGKMWRSLIADKNYRKAFEGIPDIPTTPLVKKLEDILQFETAKGLALEGMVKKVSRALTGDAGTQVVFDGSGRAISARVPSKLSPRVLQQINWEMRDLRQVQNDKSVTSAVKQKAKIIENDITRMLNTATGGKYGQADKTFSQMSKAIEQLKKGKIGKAAEKDPDQFGQILGSIFNPDPSNRALAKDFMKRVREVDPESANALYGAYFANKLADLGENPKASQMLSAVFGAGESSAKTVLDLAPTLAIKKRLGIVRQGLRDAATLESITSPQAAADAFARGEERKGPIAALGRWILPKTAARTALSLREQRIKAKAFFEAATSNKWADDFEGILSLPPTHKELQSRADDFLDRVLEDMKLRDNREAAISQLPSTLGQEALREENREEPN